MVGTVLADDQVSPGVVSTVPVDVMYFHADGKLLSKHSLGNFKVLAPTASELDVASR